MDLASILVASGSDVTNILIVVILDSIYLHKHFISVISFFLYLLKFMLIFYELIVKLRIILDAGIIWWHPEIFLTGRFSRF